jgi:maltodextrin utilization protein YvdJ
VGGPRARERLDRAKDWLNRNNATVMAVLFLVFAVVLLVEGFARD